MDRFVLALAAGAAVSAGAQGAFISFGSDSNPAAPTFTSSFDGASNTTTISSAPGATVDLLIDVDEGGPGGPITVSASFTANFELSYGGSVMLFPGFFTHVFSITNSSFEFRDSGSGDLLFGAYSILDGALSGVGSGSSIFSASMSGFGTDYTIGPAGAAIVGFGGVQLGDWGFTLTAFGSAGLIFDGNNIVGISDFSSEGSFSGSFVPAPGAAGLMGLAGLVGLRRRR